MFSISAVADCHKLSDLKKTQVYLLTVLSVRSPARILQDLKVKVLAGLWRRLRFLAFPTFTGHPPSSAHPLCQPAVRSLQSLLPPSIPSLTRLPPSFTYWDPYPSLPWVHQIIQDSLPPHFKVSNLITSAKALLLCRGLYSQFWGSGFRHLCGAVILPTRG